MVAGRAQGDLQREPGALHDGAPRGSQTGLAGFGMSPDFSPDGRWVVFTGGAHNRIVRMRRNGTGRQLVFLAEGQLIASTPDWQPVRR